MKSLKVLILAVLVPGALSAALYDALSDDDHDHRVRVEHAVAVEGLGAELEAELRGLEDEIDAAVAHRTCDHVRTEVLRMSADGLAALEVVAGAGALRVEGRDDVEEVVVTAAKCASDADLLDELTVALTRDGDRVRLETDRPGFRVFGGHARIDLEVHVPLGTPATLQDGSGELFVTGTGATSIDDGSGEIEVRDIDGTVTVRDGSGEVVVRGVAGDLDVVDGSGEVDVAEVAGHVGITDGSGSITVVDVGGDVLVRADGSGGIDVRTVAGDFRVAADGSGEIVHADVGGRVDLPRNKRER